MKRLMTGIVIFDDIEVLDFCGPFEVLSVTRLNEARRREEPSPFDVRLIAPQGKNVTTAGGMQVLAQHTFADTPPLDILVVPGGWGVRRELENPAMAPWLRQQAQQVTLLTAVCTGSMLLGQAGLLDGRHATTHWKSLDWMRQTFPGIQVDAQHHVVEDSHIITSAGISAGIDMALRIVARCWGEDVATATARHMEYLPNQENIRRV